MSACVYGYRESESKCHRGRRWKEFVTRGGGEKKWQEIKAGSGDLMESVDILTVNHSEEIRK